MTDDKTERVDPSAVLAYCDKATAGPWHGEAESADDDTGVFSEARVLALGDGSDEHPDRTIAIIRCGLTETDANWRMIIRARTDLPLLARRVLELEKERAEWLKEPMRVFHNCDEAADLVAALERQLAEARKTIERLDEDLAAWRGDGSK